MEPKNVYRVVIVFANGLFDSSTYEGVSEKEVLANIACSKFLNNSPITMVSITKVDL